jgi:pimeloyl-ACP methyl ester carboxylesterase
LYLGIAATLVSAVAAATVGIRSVGSPEQAAPAWPSLQLAPAEGSDLPQTSQCGTFGVAEYLSRTPVRILSLKLVVLPPRSKHPLEPVFYLPGGPGGAATSAARRLADSWVREEHTIVPVWPKASISASYFEPFVSLVPTVLVSGELDPVTPPKWGEEARKTLPNSVHLITRDAHADVNPCVAGIAAEVFRSGSLQTLNTSCMARETLPPLQLSVAARNLLYIVL